MDQAQKLFLIAGAGIDFNSDGAIQSRETVVGVDLNNNGRTTDTLSGTNDWERIVYKAGTIGQLHSAGATMPEDKQSENINEMTIEEALENGVLGRVGSGALEAIGPYTVPAGEYSQKIYIRVKNLSPEAVTFTLHMDSSPISSEYDGEVTLEPSIVSVSYVDIPLAILGTQSDGNYVIHATLFYSGKEVARSQSRKLCKPPKWCRMGVLLWRFELWEKGKDAARKRKCGGQRSGSCCS